ncbi:uncharacterized protein LOC133309509 isoform X1 [Gastrolobium bilobum]|uniref:uncharacterized protein LOC133309509 isoform X1 n=1 Tax=Gastrolobium bilobum TaxID=150636 RepID=UPI002AB293A3|nr:uncharacterized protein LOC133309509 isoform X1 [Gastrolobium bilobum]
MGSGSTFEVTLFASAVFNQTFLRLNVVTVTVTITHNSSQMDADEARILLGFPPNSRPTSSQVKSAYKKKVWESHPDLFPSHEKSLAESKFKLISEAHACLLSGGRGEASSSAEYSRVVRTGVPRAHGGRKNSAMIKVPFILITLGTVALGGFNASRAYKKQKEEYPSHNPFLP